jgi:uncharacterized protein (TIGR03000 family)
MCVAVGVALVFLAAACQGRAGGIGSAMYYGPYTGGHGYSYNVAYGYNLPFTANGFTNWWYPYDWSSYPYRGLAFPAQGTKGWPKVVPVPTQAELDAGIPVPAGPVRVHVVVPPDAVVWFDGAQTEQTGPSRDFQSPPLAGGQTYHYVVRARWNSNGQAVEQIQMVSVKPGQQTRVTFPQQ